MADGTWDGMTLSTTGALRLNEAIGLRASRLWAVCGCGGQSMLDPAHWLGQGLGGHSLRALEDRLRCGCGARSARLEVRGAAEAPAAARTGPYVFR